MVDGLADTAANTSNPFGLNASDSFFVNAANPAFSGARRRRRRR